MDSWQKIIEKPVESLLHAMVFVAMLALPWINKIHLSTFLFIGIGVLLVLNRDIRINYSWLSRQKIFIAFLFYYLLQIVAFIRFPEATNRAALDEKAPLLFIPILLYILITQYKSISATFIKGFVCGNILAAAYCLMNALYIFNHTGDKELFFYHTYAEPTGMGAIYFSLFIIISLIYVLKYGIAEHKPTSWQMWVYNGIAAFLFFNLLLLSSKMLIITGIILMLIFLYRSIKGHTKRFIIYSTLLVGATSLLFTNNPISRRYKDIHLDEYAPVFSKTDFTDYPFDGLNLRLLLWRMGIEISYEKHSLLYGNGSKHYQRLLDERISQYHLYIGDPKTHTTGYLHYNMHNQYMESYMQFGIIGALTVLFIILYLIYSSFNPNQNTLNLISLLFLAVFCTESVFERQSGIILFTLIISLEWIRTQQRSPYTPTT